MATLWVMVGLPGSGKSTLARAWVAENPRSRARVSRDELRDMLHNTRAWRQPWQEDQVDAAHFAAVAALLSSGVDVVVDATNLRRDRRQQLADIAAGVGASVHLWPVRTPAEECIARDADRPEEQRMGAEVILRRAADAQWPE